MDKINIETQKLNILLVDNDEKQLQDLELLVSCLDLAIYKASSGQQALTFLLHHQFILVLINMVMQDMSGMEVARLMRNNKSTSNTPIIFTTDFHKNEIEMLPAYQLGAVDYIVKPINKEILLSKIKVFRDFHLFERKKEEENLNLLAKLKAKNKNLEEARISALNMLEDANEARNAAQIAQKKLQASLERQKKTEIELKKAIKKAEKVNIYKNNFLANMSHEIRTPMNGIVGFANLMKESEFTAEERNEFIKIINSNSEQLLKLIDDIIDVAKIEAGEMKITIDKCDLNNLLYEVNFLFNQLKENKQKKDINFILETPENLPFKYIATDGFRLKQLLTNLLENALKFTEKGEIRFGYQVIKNKLIFFVQDQGIGIKKDMQNIIFERFQQALPENSGHYRGTGLGLAICKGIVNLLGGDISVQSIENQGTTFRFSIPLKIEKEEKRQDIEEITPVDSNKMKGKTILIVDNNLTIQKYFKEVLKTVNFNIIIANNGKEAINMYRENSSIKVVLMDIRMPVMDGYKAASEILKLNPEAIIIAQTAHALQEDKDKCMKLGFKDFITKPIKKENILKILAKWIK